MRHAWPDIGDGLGGRALSRPRESSTMRSVLWELGLALVEEDEPLAVWSVPESYDVNGDGAFVAPIREWKRALLLERGCWGRLRINARRIGNWSGDWSYSESMTSISWHIDAPAHLFLGEPHHAYDGRARLR